MNQNEILKKIVEYWKLNHKKYCVKVPKELTIGTVNDWILDSYEKFYNKNDEFNIGISIWREYDKIFEYILGNKCLYYTHSYYDTVKNASCTESGYVTHTCSLCGDSYTDNKTEAYGHYYEERVLREPNCTEEGISSFTCSRYGHSYSYQVPALGHAYVSTTVEATSEKEGYTEIPVY